MGTGHKLAGVCYIVPGRQGKAHAFVVHGNAVADGNSRKFQGRASGHADAGLDGFGDTVEVHVAGNNFACGIDNAYKGAVYFFAGKAECIEQGSVRSLFKAAFHQGRKFVVHREKYLGMVRCCFCLCTAVAELSLQSSARK